MAACSLQKLHGTRAVLTCTPLPPRYTVVCAMQGVEIYLQVQAAGKAPSSMYGSEHLLRLLVKLPELLPMSSLPADNYGDCP